MTINDWKQFLFLAVERHRIAPLVAGKLAHIDPPAEIRELITSAGKTNAMQVLQQMVSLQKIQASFAASGIRFGVLKGWPLAENLFENSSARMARDIDIIVEPDLLTAAARLLESLGYQAEPAHPEHHRMIDTAALTEEFNNLSFVHPDNAQLLELHWRCHQFKGWPELFGNWRNLVEVETSIGKLTTPTEQANLVYLSIHGSLHRWSRLKWLLDIAMLARRRGEAQLQTDLTFASEMNAAAPLELGLYLSANLFGTPCPETRFNSNSWLPKRCLEEISRPEAVPTGFTHRLKFYAMMLCMAEGLSQRLGIVRYRLWGKNRLFFADARRTVRT